MDRILSQDKATEIFEPYAPQIADAFEEALIDFQKLLQCSASVLPFSFSSSAKATIFHEILKDRLTAVFTDHDSVKPCTVNQVFGLLIEQSIFIRFKKFNTDYSISGIQTTQFKEFENQRFEIEGMPDSPTLLVAGYLPDKTWSKLTSIAIVCRFNKNILWKVSLKGSANVLALELFDDIDTQSEAIKSKVKLKVLPSDKKEA
jgi:hypothetical protein